MINRNPIGPPRPTKPTGHKAAGLTLPPPLSYDPSIDAERRAAKRGLKDTVQDLTTQGKYAESDLAQSLGDITTDTRRGRQNIQTDFRRGQQRIGFQRQDTSRDYERGKQRLGFQREDTKTEFGRAQKDFATRLGDISRQFTQLGQAQSQSANAAGVLDGGTAAASAAARARNQKLAERPVHTAQERASQDFATTLGRIGTAESQLGEDFATSLSRLDIGSNQLRQDRRRGVGRLHADRDRSRTLSHRQFNRGELDRMRTEQRARREQAIGDVDATTLAIFDSRQRHPGVFTKKGRRRNRRNR